MMDSANLPPLQLVLFEPSASDELCLAVRRSLSDGGDESGYIGGGEDLRVPIRAFPACPADSPREVIDGALHTLVVVVFDDALVRDRDLMQWLVEALDVVDTLANRGRHDFIPVLSSESVTEELCREWPRLCDRQFLKPWEFGEHALRAAFVSLYALHAARRLLLEALPSGAAKCPQMHLFISHAKGDGLPLALSIRSILKSHRWLDHFYDADDILPGTDWRRKLEHGVRDSVLIAVRTTHYASRHWCRQEVVWAEEYGVPIVVVEARTGLVHGADGLPFGHGPAAVVVDGNVVRVIYLALREGLRALLAIRRAVALVAAGVLGRDPRILSRAPSPRQLLHLCRAIGQDAAEIVYPEPRLDEAAEAIADAIVAKYSPNATLRCLDEGGLA